MSFNHALQPARSRVTLPEIDPLTRQLDAMTNEGGSEGNLRNTNGERREVGTLETIAGVGNEAMRSMSMDPVSATRQTLAALRRNPYIAAVLLIGLGAIIAGTARN